VITTLGIFNTLNTKTGNLQTTKQSNNQTTKQPNNQTKHIMQTIATSLAVTGPWDVQDTDPITPLPIILPMDESHTPIPPLSPSLPSPSIPKEIDPITLIMSKINKFIMNKQMKISRIFGDIDTSGNGILDPIEFRQGVRAIIAKADFILSNDEINTIFNRCDKDRSGELDYKEFEREIKNADLQRAAAIKARREASQASASSLAKSRKSKKKGTKGKKAKKKDWRENRRKMIRASPDIIRWIVDDDFNNTILRHEDEERKEKEKLRKSRMSMYRRSKKTPSLLKRAMSTLPPLPSLLVIGDSTLMTPNKDEGYDTAQIVTKYRSRSTTLGGPIRSFLPASILGRNSLPTLPRSQTYADDDSFDSFDSLEFITSEESDADDYYQNDDNNNNNNKKVEEDQRHEQQQQQLHLSKSEDRLGYIKIQHGSLRSGAFAGAVGSYHEIISSHEHLSSHDQGIHLIEKYPESNVQEMNLSNNHINARTLRVMLEKFPSISHVKSIDLNFNSIGPQGAIALANSIVKRPMKSSINKNPNRVRLLTCIRLERNNIGDRGVKMLCQALRVCKSLQTLCLPYNNIGSSGGTSIGTLLGKAPKLTEIDLSNNQIRGTGAAALTFGLVKSKSLLWCDLSFNSLGKSPDRQASRTLARSLKKNKVLTHLDLSMNRLDWTDVATLGTALKSNRTLLGLHCLGNEGTVDCRGFLIPKKKPLHTQLIHLPNRCVSLANQMNKGATRQRPRKGSGCWICGQWSPVEFIWTVGRSEGFNLVRKQLGVLREIFHHHAVGQQLNVSGSGYLPKTKLAEVLTFLNIHMEQSELLEVASLLDRDNSGKIEFGELVSIVARCLYLQTSSKHGGGSPAEVLLVIDFGSTYVNEEPTPMIFNSTSRTFSTTIMCPPTKVNYHFVIDNKTCRCAADQPMEAPAPASTLAEANRWKLKKNPTLDAFVFPANDLLALRNYVDVDVDIQYQKSRHDCEKPRQPRVQLKKVSKKANNQSGWTLATSVFKGWKDETEKMMEKCFKADWSKCEYKLKRFIKNPDDLYAVKDILEEHYVDLMNIFKYNCCFEMGEDPFDIQINGTMEFCSTCDIIDTADAKTADLDTIFIATNYTAKKQKNNPDRAIVRYQWMEYVARVALAKFSKPAIPGDDPLEPPLALDKLMEKNICPLAKSIDSLPLRHDFFWNNDFDRLLRDFQKDVDVLFDQFARSIDGSKMIGTKPALSLNEFVSLLNATKLCKKPKVQKKDGSKGTKTEKKEKLDGGSGGGGDLDNSQQRDIKTIFVASKQIFVDPLTTRQQKEMSRMEFYEALGRIADYRLMLAKGQTLEMLAKIREAERELKNSKKKKKKKKGGKKGSKKGSKGKGKKSNKGKKKKKKKGAKKVEAAKNALAALKAMQGMAGISGLMKLKASPAATTCSSAGGGAGGAGGAGGESGKISLMNTFSSSTPVVIKSPMEEFLESLSEVLVKIKTYLAKPVKQKGAEDRFKVLEKVKMFEDLTAEQYRALSTVMTLHTYEDGECILKEGDKADSLHVIVYCNANKNQAEIKKQNDQQQHSHVRIMGKQNNNAPPIELQQIVVGDIFGHVGLSVDQKNRSRTASAYAKGNIETLILKRDDFADLCRKKILDRTALRTIEQMSQHYVGEQEMRAGIDHASVKSEEDGEEED